MCFQEELLLQSSLSFIHHTAAFRWCSILWENSFKYYEADKYIEVWVWLKVVWLETAKTGEKSLMFFYSFFCVFVFFNKFKGEKMPIYAEITLGNAPVFRPASNGFWRPLGKSPNIIGHVMSCLHMFSLAHENEKIVKKSTKPVGNEENRWTFFPLCSFIYQAFYMYTNCSSNLFIFTTIKIRWRIGKISNPSAVLLLFLVVPTVPLTAKFKLMQQSL